MESKQNTKLEQAKEVVRLVMDEDYSIEEALKKVKKQNQIDVTEYMGFVNYIINNLYKKYDFLNKRYEKEDLFQIGCVALLEASKTFDRNKKGTAKFTSYAGNAIRYTLLNYAKRDKKYNLKQNQPHNYLIYSLDYEVFDNDGKSIPFEEILNVDGYNNLFEDSIIGKIGAEELLSILDTDERKIAYMYFLERKSQREIAEKIKIKQTTVRNKVIEIRNKLKETTKNTHQNILSSTNNNICKNSTSLYHSLEVCQCQYV